MSPTPDTETTGGRPVVRWDGYDLISEIGRGGMGTVFLCRRSGEHGFRRLFALKRLHPQLENDEGFTTMLLDEARIAARLHHPNVAAVVDLARVGPAYSVVMEYVEGPSLRELLSLVKSERRPEFLLPLFIDVLEGLHAAHTLHDDHGVSLQLVHRDVSPSNVLVGIDGFARLSDFGIAKARARITTTAVGVRKGKVGFVAPEVFMNPALADPRSDLFAVGTMIWSALTARRLFQSDTEEATIYNLLQQEIGPPSMAGLRPPACLDGIVLRALARNPNERYQTAREMADDLRQVGSANRLLASPARIGDWVKSAWGAELALRRQTVRLAAETAGELASATHATRGVADNVGAATNRETSHRPPGQHETMPRIPDRRRTVGLVLIGTLAGVVLGGLAGFGLIVQGIEEDSGDERSSGALATAVGATTPPAPTPSPDCGDDMVLIDGGEFFMGSDSEAGALSTARPVHKVRVGDFCLDKTEVTVDAYRACSQQGICRRAFRDSWWPRGDDDETEWKTDRDIHSRLCNERYDDRGTHPINCVSWHQAKAYCAQVGKALPTEEQWEFAARRMDGRVYSWGDSKPDSERMNGCGSECSAWRQAMGAKPTPPLYEADDGFPGSAPVGSFPAGNTKEGISDLAGNVFEWTDDEFRPYGEIAKLAEESPGRVIRGGAFNSYKPEFADPALRFPLAADAHSHGVGFRCAAKVR